MNGHRRLKSYPWRTLLIASICLVQPSAYAVEKVSVTSKTPITMTVRKQQSLVVQGATVQNAKSASVVSARNRAVRGFTTRLSCKAPVRKGAKSSCDVKLTITGSVPLGRYTLNLLDGRRQVIAAGRFEVQVDPAMARKQQAAAKPKARQKAADPQKRQKVVQRSSDKKARRVRREDLIVTPKPKRLSVEGSIVGLATQDGEQFIAAPDPLSQVTAPDGTPVTVGNPYPKITISSFTAAGDTSSGKRQARISFATENANPTHYRAVSVNHLNSDAPFSGIAWRSYTGGQPIVELFECGLSSLDNYRIALQVKGPDVQNPSSPSQLIANISPIVYSVFSLPESLRSRVSWVGRFPGAGAGGSDPVQMSGNTAVGGGLVRLGNQTVGSVASFLVEIENYPSSLNANSVKSVPRSCFVVTAAENVTSEPGGVAKVVIDGRFDFSGSSCQPQISVGQCGTNDERFHAREFPLRFDKITTVYTDTNSIAHKFSIGSETAAYPGCQGFEGVDGDLSFSTESPGPLPLACNAGLAVIFDDGYSESWTLFFKSSSEGQCGLGRTFFNGLFSSALNLSPSYRAMRNALSRRQSDFNWAYDSRMPMSVQPDNLNTGLYTPASSYKFFHSCGLSGGSIRTWLDKAEHTRFEPVVRTGRQ